MFDSLAVETLDFTKETTLQSNGVDGLDALFDKLVMRDTNYAMVMKIKPRIECPPIRMKGIILEIPCGISSGNPALNSILHLVVPI